MKTEVFTVLQIALAILVLLEILTRLVFSTRLKRLLQKLTSSKITNDRLGGNFEVQNTELTSEKERFKSLDIPIRTLDPLGELPTFEGAWINVRAGRRVTTGEPTHWSGRVLCLGGSTTFCGEVGDNQTWPSVLQQSLNDARIPVRVENLGRMGATAINRLVLLREREQLDDVDAVVLLFGINDAGWVQLRDLEGIPLVIRQLIASRLGVSRLAYKFVERRVGRRSGIRAATRTLSELEMAADFLHERKIPFLVALQPHYWLNRTWPNSLDWKRSDQYSVRRDFLFALEGAYSVFRRELPWIESVAYLNLELCLDELGDSAYVDWAHNSSSGCRTIGLLIGSAIRRLLSGSHDTTSDIHEKNSGKNASKDTER